jgi:hypothetical protein
MGSVVRISPGNQMGIEMLRLGPTQEDALQEFQAARRHEAGLRGPLFLHVEP